MRSSIACGLAVSAVLAGAALAAKERPVEPGGKIGVMTVVRGDTYNSEENVFVPCPISTPKPGAYHRSCLVPKVPRLFIGGVYDVRSTQQELDKAWRDDRWRLWVDGRPVDLPRFGTTDRHHYDLNGKLVFSRNWKVTLAGASGKHTIHYQVQTPSGAIDFTVAITIEE